MKYLNSLYETVPSIRILASNAGLNNKQVNEFSDKMANCGEFCQTTLKFLYLVAKNRRYMYINDIAKKFVKSYLLLTKEEKITIISAYELSESEKNSVKEALSGNKDNEGKTFVIDYNINPLIIGGLQMFTSDRFMDMSLSSRIDKLKDEVNKLI